MVLNALNVYTLPRFLRPFRFPLALHFFRASSAVFCPVGNRPERLTADRTGLQMVIAHDLRLKCPAVPIFQKDIPEEPADQ
jgi:hypothetical protein